MKTESLSMLTVLGHEKKDGKNRGEAPTRWCWGSPVQAKLWVSRGRPLIASVPCPSVDGHTPAAGVVGLTECFVVLLLLSPEGKS